MMIAMAVGFTVLLGGGFLMASRVIHALGLRESSDKTTMRSPLGDFRVEKAREVGPGLPVYPQATMILPGTQDAHLPQNNDLPQVVASSYYTNSSREYVVNWYLGHLSPEFVRRDNGPKNLPAAFRDSHISDDDIAFVGERGDQIRVVALAQDDAGTKITLLRTSTKPPEPSPAQ
jgi:hypothetical protein